MTRKGRFFCVTDVKIFNFDVVFEYYLLLLHNWFFGYVRGRNKSLIQKRDDALCRRWYYWTERQRLRYDDALKQLSEREFFISEERIMSIIRTKAKEVDAIVKRGVPKVRKPRLTEQQLCLFMDEDF